MISSDYHAYNLTPWKLVYGFFTGHCFYAVLLYRIGNWFARKHWPGFPYFVIPLQRIFFSCEISPYATIGSGFRLHHSAGIVIGHACVIGDNVQVFQNVTLGANTVQTCQGRLMPIVGNNVSIYAGACVAGPITIGDNVSIGANSVVLRDVEANVTVAGAPAKVICKE